MTSRLWILTTLIYYVLFIARISAYDNATKLKNESSGDEVDEVLSKDVYMLDASRSCRAGSVFACFKTGAGSVLLDLMSSVRQNYKYEEDSSVTLIKTTLPSDRSSGRTDGRYLDDNSFLGFLIRSADRYIRTTGLVLDLDDDVTEGGLYKPRFIDEIYSEIETLEDKNAKPNKRYEFKRLFIPMLLILKLFKLKLLVLLPFLLGLASFKKIIALLAIIIPGIIGYLKLCKPDLGHTYGSFGHSSFYNSPPSAKHKDYLEIIPQNSPQYYNEEYSHQMAYQAHRNG